MRILLLINIALFFSCDLGHGSKEEDNKIETLPIQTTFSSKAFLDSVIQKKELLGDQIRKHTIIDSIFYTGRHSEGSFIGDTVFKIGNLFYGAVIKWDDGSNCTHQILLIFHRTADLNTDYKFIFSDCDRDESADYFSLEYKLFTDSTFETIESYIPPNSENVTEVEKIIWKVNGKGKIVPLN